MIWKGQVLARLAWIQHLPLLVPLDHLLWLTSCLILPLLHFLYIHQSATCFSGPLLLVTVITVRNHIAAKSYHKTQPWGTLLSKRSTVLLGLTAPRYIIIKLLLICRTRSSSIRLTFIFWATSLKQLTQKANHFQMDDTGWISGWQSDTGCAEDFAI